MRHSIAISCIFLALAACSDSHHLTTKLRAVDTTIKLSSFKPGKINLSLCLGEKDPDDQNTQFLTVAQKRDNVAIPELKLSSEQKLEAFSKDKTCHLEDKSSYKQYIVNETDTIYVSANCSKELSASLAEGKKMVSSQNVDADVPTLRLVAETVLLCGKLQLNEKNLQIYTKNLILSGADIAVTTTRVRDNVDIYTYNLKILGPSSLRTQLRVLNNNQKIKEGSSLSLSVGTSITSANGNTPLTIETLVNSDKDNTDNSPRAERSNDDNTDSQSTSAMDSEQGD